jgi:hypothetical protein
MISVDHNDVCAHQRGMIGHARAENACADHDNPHTEISCLNCSMIAPGGLSEACDSHDQTKRPRMSTRDSQGEDALAGSVAGSDVPSG